MTHEEAKFRVGDIVYVNVPNRKIGKTKKFLPQWMGPATILSKDSPVLYTVEMAWRGKTVEKQWHAARLKLTVTADKLADRDDLSEGEGSVTVLVPEGCEQVFNVIEGWEARQPPLPQIYPLTCGRRLTPDNPPQEATLEETTPGSRRGRSPLRGRVSRRRESASVVTDTVTEEPRYPRRTRCPPSFYGVW